MSSQCRSETSSLREPLTALPGGSEARAAKARHVNGFTVTRWKELIEVYQQLAAVTSERDYPNKTKLLVMLHEHLYLIVPWQRLPLDMRARTEELKTVVIHQFRQAAPSEQLLLALDRLYSCHENGFFELG